ncbi:hypothetical protein DFH06DRAFT_1472473 [Mycena polygramma]|nr:hypothetical protein DFH06DRAFT_1472473 [Mycena polygramma]
MASIMDLPPELLDKIVSEFEDDPPNLRTCALISPAFLPWTRQHLFSSVRLTASNVYAFRALVEFSPAVASYVRSLDIPTKYHVPASALLPPATLAQLPNITHLTTHCDPFGFRHLSPADELVLASAARRLTAVDVLLIDRLWTLPLWAALLNDCPALATLTVHAEASGLGIWSAADVALPMPAPHEPGGLRLHTLRVSGDCKILMPLGAWLLPQGALEALHTLVLDLEYLPDDYDAPDARTPIVLAAAASLRELRLHLDPPMSLVSPSADGSSIAIPSHLPHLRVLHLRDGPDPDIADSLAWLGALLQPTPSPSPSLMSDSCESALEHLSINHSIIRHKLLAVPATTWRAIEGALLGDSDNGDMGYTAAHEGSMYPHLRTVTFEGYHRLGAGAPEAFAHFSRTLRERLPRLVERVVVAPAFIHPPVARPAVEAIETVLQEGFVSSDRPLRVPDTVPPPHRWLRPHPPAPRAPPLTQSTMSRSSFCALSSFLSSFSSFLSGTAPPARHPQAHPYCPCLLSTLLSAAQSARLSAWAQGYGCRVRASAPIVPCEYLTPTLPRSMSLVTDALARAAPAADGAIEDGAGNERSLMQRASVDISIGRDSFTLPASSAFLSAFSSFLRTPRTRYPRASSLPPVFALEAACIGASAAGTGVVRRGFFLLSRVGSGECVYPQPPSHSRGCERHMLGGWDTRQNASHTSKRGSTPRGVLCMCIPMSSMQLPFDAIAEADRFVYE